MGNQDVAILIDSGITHNFLDPSIIRNADLPINTSEKVRVRVANEEQIVNEGKCVEMRFKVQEIVFSTEVHILVLARCDMVIRVQCLKKLGSILWDFVNLSMEFQYKEK